MLRANAHSEAHDDAAAIADARAALAAPELEPAADALLDVAVAAKARAVAVEALDAMLANGSNQRDLDRLIRAGPRYEGLVRSAAYERWLAVMKQVSKAAARQRR